MAELQTVKHDLRERVSGGKFAAVTGQGIAQHTRTDSDWVPLNKEVFSYDSALVVNVNNTILQPLSYFRKGDLLRIKQNDTWGYYYITRVPATDDQIYIEGGNAYTFTNDPIEDISYSRVRAAFGHPVVIPFTTVAAGAGSMIVTLNTQSCFFYMDGPVFNVYISITATISGTPSAVVDLTTPIGDMADLFAQRMDTGYVNLGVNNSAFVRMVMSPWPESHVQLDTLGNFTAGGLAATLKGSFLYYFDDEADLVV